MKMHLMPRWISHLLFGCGLLFILSGCFKNEQQALGTLEWDRVNGRAVASEAVVEILVHEGAMVKEGQPILRLDPSLQQAQVVRLQANVQQAQWNFEELKSGYREEEIATAKADLEGAQFQQKTMQIEFERKAGLTNTTAVSERSVDFSANQLAQAKARNRAAAEQFSMMKSGYRTEQIEQAKAQLAAAKAELKHAEAQLALYTVVAERDGLLDSLPFKLGDRPPVGTVVSTVLAGKSPWARVYLPQPWLSSVKVGDQVDIFVDGRADAITGQIRHIESSASFTPYYTLSEEDRSRLSYVTEVDLDPVVAKDLPLGIPLRMKRRHD